MHNLRRIGSGLAVLTFLFVEKDLAEFNRMLRDRGIQNAIGRLP